MAAFLGAENSTVVVHSVYTCAFERSRWRQTLRVCQTRSIVKKPRIHANARESEFVDYAFPLHPRSTEVDPQSQMQSRSF